MPKLSIAHLVFAISVLYANPLSAEISSLDIAVPIIIIDAGRSLESKAIDQLVTGFSSPVLRGDNLKNELSILNNAAQDCDSSIKEIFLRAQDVFFAGQHQEALQKFEQVISLANENPACYFHSPAIREDVFKSHLHLAVIARGQNDEREVTHYFELAARRFPEFVPKTVDFPPWVRERFEEVRKELPLPKGMIELDVPEECELILSGRNLGKGRQFKKLEPGSYVAKVRCQAQESPLFSVTIGDEPEVVRPLITHHSQVVLTGREFVLKARPGAEETELVRDALSVAASSGWTKLVAVLGYASGEGEIWLLDQRLSGLIQRIPLIALDDETLRRAGRKLVTQTLSRALLMTTETQKPWYKDGLAWSFFGVGIAAAAVGLTLATLYGSPSAIEPASWALIIGGSGFALTGTALFFTPIVAPAQQDSLAKTHPRIGIGAALHF